MTSSSYGGNGAASNSSSNFATLGRISSVSSVNSIHNFTSCISSAFRIKLSRTVNSAPGIEFSAKKELEHLGI